MNRTTLGEKSPRPAAVEALGDDRSQARRSLRCGVEALLSLQNVDGHWRGELEGDSILNSEYLLMLWAVGLEHDPRVPALIAYLRRLQQPDGAWVQYPGGSIDVSATVKAWLCLRLAGDSPEQPHMRAAADLIRAHGGAEACNSFTNFYFACLGLISWEAVPAIPPELQYLPRWCPFNMDHVSAWSRTMILPLAVCTALRPARALPEGISLEPLFLDRRNMQRLAKKREPRFGSWTNFFLRADAALKALQRWGVTPGRGRALRDAEAWIRTRSDPQHTEGLGAIFPPMIYTIIALRALGRPMDDPCIRETLAQLDRFFITDERTGEIRIQPCLSPVWDTGIALYALTDAGFDLDHDTPDGAVARACRWLRERENTLAGDWSRTVDAERAGWYFEYRNEWYPDVDDTAMVAMALKRAGGAENAEAAARGVAWILAMQNDDGGWAAFDRTKDRPILEKVPFADHNAMQDPSCPDITGRVLECLAWHGHTAQMPHVQRAIDFIRSRQEPEGCWFGRWGVNYIYGTWQAVCGLRRIGCDMSQPWVLRAAEWLKSVQRADGSFGESPDTYLDRSLMGHGPSTASQTAWAAITLQNILGPDDPDCARAIGWLSETQLAEADAFGNPAGSWHEPWFTGTGFPKVFYLRYHLYRLYFPVMAIAKFVRESDRG